MPKSKLLTFSLLAVVFTTTSCTLDDRPKCDIDGMSILGITLDGNQSAALTKPNELNLSIDSEKDIYDTISRGYCPERYNCIDAVKDEQILGKVCTKLSDRIEYPISCDEASHFYKSICEPDSLENCGAHGNKCKFENGVPACVNGECQLESCNEGYTLNDQTCVPNVVCEPENCHIEHAATVFCNDQNECDVAICDEGFHLYNHKCEQDSVENCGAHSAECDIENAESVSCQNAKCVIDACSAGYHKNENKCESDEIKHCGEPAVDCETTAGWAAGTCQNGVCIASKCQGEYYYQDGHCIHVQRDSGVTIDPWGLIWDAVPNSPTTHEYAVTECQNNKGRLPTPTEIYRNRANNTEVSDVIGTTSQSDFLWTSAMGASSANMLMADLQDGTAKGDGIAKEHKYRCVWDPEPHPITFTGNNCHGNPGEKCEQIILGKIAYTVDTRDRAPQPWLSAAEECRNAGGRLPTVTEAVLMVQHELPNWTNTAIWTEHSSLDGASLIKTQPPFTASRRVGETINQKKTFRCVSEPVLLKDGQPVFPENEIETVAIDPLLRFDKEPHAPMTYREAAAACISNGGHLPTEDELSQAIHKKAKLNYQSGTPYFTSSINGQNTGFRILFNSTQTADEYYYIHSSAKAPSDATSKIAFFCAYRPLIDFDFSELDTNDQIYKVTSGGVTYYLENKDTLRALNLYEADGNAREKGMRIPRDGELHFLFSQADFPNQTGDLLMTSVTYHKDDVFHRRNLKWNAQTKLSVVSPTGWTSLKTPSRFFTSTVIQ